MLPFPSGFTKRKIHAYAWKEMFYLHVERVVTKIKKAGVSSTLCSCSIHMLLFPSFASSIKYNIKTPKKILKTYIDHAIISIYDILWWQSFKQLKKKTNDVYVCASTGRGPIIANFHVTCERTRIFWPFFADDNNKWWQNRRQNPTFASWLSQQKSGKTLLETIPLYINLAEVTQTRELHPGAQPGLFETLEPFGI